MGGLTERQLIIALLWCGALARLVWAAYGQNFDPLINESHNIAVSIAQHGQFANPFMLPTGPTAHIGMLTPLPAALAYWLFGVDTPVAEFGLCIFAATIVATEFWLCWRLACELDVSPVTRVLLVAFLSLAPLQYGLEMREGKTWEVNLAVTMLLWVLLRIVLADKTPQLSKQFMAATGAIIGLLAILSPPAGLAASTALFVFLLNPHRGLKYWCAPVAIAFVMVPLTIFWAERNLHQLGAAIPLRDNLELELALSNYSGAIYPADPHTAYLARITEIHPMSLSNAIRLAAQGGELPYYHKLGAQVYRWIAAHPADFAYLSMRRFIQFYFPPRWFWGTFGTVTGNAVTLRQALVWTTAFLGFCTAGFMAYRKRFYRYLLAAIISSSIIYIIVQPTLRYRYLVSSLLITMAFDGAGRVSNRFRQYLVAQPPPK